MPKDTKVILRRAKDTKRTWGDLTSSEKYSIFQLYTEGKGHTEISKTFNIPPSTLSTCISSFIKSLTLVQESNKLENSKVASCIDRTAKTSKEITDEFKEDAQNSGLTFAWYYGKTSDIKYSLKASGLDKGIPAKLPGSTKDYVLRVRGQYLLSIKAVKDEVNSVRQQELLDNKVDRSYVMSEILGQLEEEKILRSDNPQSRTNSIKLIKMLGDSVGAFTTNINVSEVSPEDSLQVLIEMAEKDIINDGEYMIEDSKDE
ncbi:MAG: hypothetical protein KAR42_17390 [candidate division Zixibacteria bacterium]|nr:hypothetical protein [candidate division Zixibacteria bacterium]